MDAKSQLQKFQVEFIDFVKIMDAAAMSKVELEAKIKSANENLFLCANKFRKFLEQDLVASVDVNNVNTLDVLIEKMKDSCRHAVIRMRKEHAEMRG